MDIIKDKHKANDGLNRVLNHSENAKQVAQHLDDVIFEYVTLQAREGNVMSDYENDRIMTIRELRDFFYSLRNNSNLKKDQ